MLTAGGSTAHNILGCMKITILVVKLCKCLGADTKSKHLATANSVIFQPYSREVLGDRLTETIKYSGHGAHALLLSSGTITLPLKPNCEPIMAPTKMTKIDRCTK